MQLVLQEWIQSSAKAFAALAEGRMPMAAELWLRAAEQIALAHASAPLRAAAHNNAGVAFLLRSQVREAADHFSEATRLWGRAYAHVESLDVPIAGRSSVFHLRLAMQHHEAFAELRRRRFLDVCIAARTITQYNAQLGGLDSRGDRDALEADQSIIGVIAAALGPECAEVHLLREEDVAQSAAVRAAYRSKADRLMRRVAGSYVHAAGYRADLDCAAQLTALLHPTLLPATPALERGELENDD
ncbi:MAG: hypothetical protein ACK4TP_03225 [Hyphomicrobium sp.]